MDDAMQENDPSDIQTRISNALREYQIAHDEKDITRQYKAWLDYCELMEKDRVKRAA